jgi:hypothetical protein
LEQRGWCTNTTTFFKGNAQHPMEWLRRTKLTCCCVVWDRDDFFPCVLWMMMMMMMTQQQYHVRWWIARQADEDSDSGFSTSF